jgi:hypothetical protein
MRSEAIETNGDGSRPVPPLALQHDAWGRLVLTDATGRQYIGIEVVRAFPISAPRHGISLCDAEGRELVWMDDLEALPASLLETIEKELGQREFIPRLRRIIRISAPVEPSEWEVDTDRGRSCFIVDSEDNVYRLDEHRALLTDSHGVRYLIPDTRQLDSTSRRLLERFL